MKSGAESHSVMGIISVGSRCSPLTAHRCSVSLCVPDSLQHTLGDTQTALGPTSKEECVSLIVYNLAAGSVNIISSSMF